MKPSIIPENIKGKSLDLQHDIICESENVAIEVFYKAARRLLQPEGWHKLAGDLSADFHCNRKGKILQRGDIIAIDLPAPGLPSDNGYDWVMVDKIERNIDKSADDSIAITLKVCVNPEKPEEGIAHFLGEGASSTFIIHRKASLVSATYHGRNETPNNKHTGIVSKIRNNVIAMGAFAGLSELQWTQLLKGLLS